MAAVVGKFKGIEGTAKPSFEGKTVGTEGERGGGRVRGRVGGDVGGRVGGEVGGMPIRAGLDSTPPDTSIGPLEAPPPATNKGAFSSSAAMLIAGSDGIKGAPTPPERGIGQQAKLF